MTEHAVVIAGGGPTGLMLAGELALAGVDVAIVERRASQELVGSRAGGLHSRTIEVFDQRGIADRFLAQGQVAQVARLRRHRFGHQRLSHPAQLRARAVAEPYRAHPRRLGRRVGGADLSRHRGQGLRAGRRRRRCRAQSNGRSLRAQYLVGCDGGRSLVRKAAGIEFPGSDPTTSNLIAEVELAEEPPEWGIRRDAVGIHVLQQVGGRDGRAGRILVTEQHVGATTEPTLRDLSEALIAVYGTDYGIHSPTSISRFTDMTRQAAAYRKGRVLLAGDAAHVHPPDGGQGLQTGVQDAVNLGWKLAQVVKGTSPESLLDTYHAERHPVAARVLRNTMASIVASPRRRAHEGTARHHVRTARHGRAAQAVRRDDVRSGHSLRSRRGTPAARTPHARSRPGHRQRPAAGLRPAARCPADRCSISVSPAVSTSRRGRIGSG